MKGMIQPTSENPSAGGATRAFSPCSATNASTMVLSSDAGFLHGGDLGPRGLAIVTADHRTIADGVVAASAEAGQFHSARASRLDVRALDDDGVCAIATAGERRRTRLKHEPSGNSSFRNFYFQSRHVVSPQSPPLPCADKSVSSCSGSDRSGCRPAPPSSRSRSSSPAETRRPARQ